MRRKRRLIWTSLTAAAVSVPVAAPPQAAPAAPALVAGTAGTQKAGLGGNPARPHFGSNVWLTAGGEGGEGGEGGIDPARAKDDPVAYLIALDVMAAHFHAGRAAYLAGHKEEGAEMFAHAISEVHAELEPVLSALGVKDFKPLMEKSVEIASAKADPAQVQAAADAVLAALTIAANHAPKSALTPIDVQRLVLADMLNRAAQQYSSAMRATEGDAYLDGFGFATAARLRAPEVMAQLTKSAPETAAKLNEALDLMGKAYASIEKPTPPVIEPGELFVVISKAMLALGSS